MNSAFSRGVTFHIGDKVVLDEGNLIGMAPSALAVVNEYGRTKPLTIRALPSGDHVYFEEVKEPFYLRRFKKQIPTVINEDNMNEYSFTITHPHALDTELLNKECTRETPLLFIRMGGNFYAKIHKSIVNKSISCGIKRPKVTSTTIIAGSLLPIQGGDHQVIVDWVRKVKNAPWPNNKPVKVVVTKVKL